MTKRRIRMPMIISWPLKPAFWSTVLIFFWAAASLVVVPSTSSSSRSSRMFCPCSSSCICKPMCPIRWTWSPSWSKSSSCRLYDQNCKVVHNSILQKNTHQPCIGTSCLYIAMQITQACIVPQAACSISCVFHNAGTVKTRASRSCNSSPHNHLLSVSLCANKPFIVLLHGRAEFGSRRGIWLSHLGSNLFCCFYWSWHALDLQVTSCLLLLSQTLQDCIQCCWPTSGDDVMRDTKWHISNISSPRSPNACPDSPFFVCHAPMTVDFWSLE